MEALEQTLGVSLHNRSLELWSLQWLKGVGVCVTEKGQREPHGAVTLSLVGCLKLVNNPQPTHYLIKSQLSMMSGNGS